MNSPPLETEAKDMAARGTSIRFEIDADLKSQFQKLCNLKQTNMTDVLTKLIEKEVESGSEILKLFESVATND
jgi:hypothetical protein